MEIRLTQVGNRMVAGLLFSALLVILSGCSLSRPNYLSQVPGTPSKALISDVPFWPQEELQCGPAALAMVLNWSGVSVEPSELTKEVYTPGLKGSLQSSLIGGARRHGRVAYTLTGIEFLMAEISAGNPVIVLVNLGFSWYPQWHYAVAIGYDREREEVILHSGTTANEVVSSRTFKNVWKRGKFWGLLVLPPEKMPKMVEEEKWLEAVAGLENTGKWGTAAVGYSTALKKWGKSFLAWMGLGNSLYNLGDLDSSAEAFYQATLIQPDNGVAFNNWAHVLAEQGNLHEAEAAAQHAVDLGGPLHDTFVQTLKEIKRMKSLSENIDNSQTDGV